MIDNLMDGHANGEVQMLPAMAFSILSSWLGTARGICLGAVSVRKSDGQVQRSGIPKGDTLVWQGDHSTDIFLVVDGELSVLLEIRDRSRLVNVLKAGEVFGDMALFTGGLRSATVRAKTCCLCFVLKVSDLGMLAHQHPVILMKMEQVLARRLADAISRQRSLA